MPEFLSQLVISTDRQLLDRPMIHRYLSEESYWAQHIPRALVDRSIDHSLCFGAYLALKQVAFARVVTDFATMAYLADVFVLPEYRRQGISKKLMQTIMDYPELQGLRRWMLATRDAHSLYAEFGWKAPAHPDRYMEIVRPNLYRLAENTPN